MTNTQPIPHYTGPVYAHYFAGSTTKLLVLSTSPKASDAKAQIKVTGKTEARKLAAFYGAKPWNF